VEKIQRFWLLPLDNPKKFLTFLKYVLLYDMLLFIVSIKLIFGGDIMLDNWIEHRYLQKERGFTDSLTAIFSSSDAAFANLEAPFGTDGEPADKEYTFLVDPELAGILKKLKLTGVFLANNHIMDYGVDGLKFTLKILKDNNIGYAGAGMNLKGARTPLIVKIKDKKIGVLSYSNTFPVSFYAGINSPGTAPGYWGYVKCDVKKLKNQVDILIVAFHWGEELCDSIKHYQRVLAHLAIDMGANIVVGSHPHKLLPIEKYKSGIIAYSLGNLIFSSYGKGNGGLLCVDIGDSIKSFRVIPLITNPKITDFRTMVKKK